VKFDNIRQSKVPVLVFGAGITALGVIRTFGRAGIPVYCLTESTDIIGDSRWFRRLGQPPCIITSIDGLVPFLESLPIDKAILMPCSDDWVVALSDLPEHLRDRFPTSLSAHDVLESLADKGKFTACLEQFDIPHPRTVLLSSADDITNAGIDDFSNYFLKPHNSQAFCAHYGIKAVRVPTRDKALAEFREKAGDGFEVLLQEYIPGGPDSHYFIDGFVDRSGAIKSLFPRRRLRMFPLDFGNSSYMRSISPTDISKAVDAITRLLTKIGFRGIFSAEFKCDPRDGVYKILEINARPWWFVGFAADCGVPVCLQAYQDALGMEVSAVEHFAVGAKYVHLYYDFYACKALRREGKIGFLSWGQSWLMAKHPMFVRDDPSPAIRWWWNLIKRKLSK